ncbi:MAG: DUF2157 domain-containing protein [Actinobacteria bacterium]|uniref:Unannotated protein n=1 Tax=freshwater metagenome TaxID=449393 RepID=A0A6J7C0H3_9ZZZZ|nr:DUF2157 domain-containing protein [Actinomycetota bacterium]MSX54862.1 DUF2157 domain-containing protein [Actinomycetota bacterium]MSZ81582.1 DUF2157 domain-containing protein [Actinomycetota bacterium]MTB17985.1 DUF2157 domain-containing protein [Actinomycetota bacterium]
MIGLAPLVLVALVLAGVYAAGHHSGHPASPMGPMGLAPRMRQASHHPSRPTGAHSGTAHQPRTATPTAEDAPPDTALDTPLDAALADWCAAGLITDEQSERIRSYEYNAVELARAVNTSALEAAPAQRRVPFIAEALGYLGGVLGLAGIVLLMARYWPDMSTPGRLAITGGGTAALALAGALVHESETALTRLRWFLWLLSSTIGAVFAGVLGAKALGFHPADKVALVVATMVTVQNAAFWWWRDRPVQQTLTLVGASTLVGTFVAQFTGVGLTGLTLVAFGVALAVTGWRSLTPAPELTALVGAATMVVGSAMLSSEWHGWGMALMLAVVGAILIPAAWPGDVCDCGVRVALTVVGCAGALQAVPSTVGYFSQQAGILTGSAVWLAGVGLVSIGNRRVARAPLVLEILGGIGVVAGTAVMGFESVAVATLAGLATAICLLALGAAPGRVLMSLFGSAGLLVNVPWSITHFFPGEGRVPVLIIACGTVIIAIAVWMSRMGGRLRDELSR